jgi:hypothetical protein
LNSHVVRASDRNEISIGHTIGNRMVESSSSEETVPFTFIARFSGIVDEKIQSYFEVQWQG